jgi:hypothetical protein
MQGPKQDSQHRINQYMLVRKTVCSNNRYIQYLSDSDKNVDI